MFSLKLLTKIPRQLQLIIFFLIFAFIVWKIILYGFGSILSFSFWLDDWPLIWGVAKEKTFPINPANIYWHFEDARFTNREGFLQIWAAYILYKTFNLNPYWYHLFGLLSKLIATLAITWVGWKLSKRVYLGVISGLIFSTAFMGLESLYWFNVNSAYLLIAIVAISLPFFIEGIQGNKKSFIFSLVLISLGIILYPPRAHVFLAYPAIALIWQGKIFDKRVWIKLLILLTVMTLSYKLPSGEGAQTQAYNAIIHRLIVFSGDGFNAGNTIFLTYPLVAIPYSMLAPQQLTTLFSFPNQNPTG